MLHEMNLQPQPFALISSGRKTIELRLYDEKRQKICVSDTIILMNTDDPGQQLRVLVKKLHRFSSFEVLYENLPLEQCGYMPDEIPSASAADMDQYYSREKQAEYGVVGIEIELL